MKARPTPCIKECAMEQMCFKPNIFLLPLLHPSFCNKFAKINNRSILKSEFINDKWLNPTCRIDANNETTTQSQQYSKVCLEVKNQNYNDQKQAQLGVHQRW